MRRRIIICLGSLLALYLLGGASAILCLDRSTRQLNSLVESHRIQSMRVALDSAGLRVESDLLASAHGHSRGTLSRAVNEQRLIQALRRCGSCHHDRAIKTRLDGIRATLQDYVITAKQLLVEPNVTRAETLEREALDLASRLVRQTTETAELAGQHLVAKSDQAASSVRTARRVLLATLGAALVVGGFIAFHLKQRLTKPVEALLEGIDRVRNGDLAPDFSMTADKEFRVLGSAFNKAYEDLKIAHEGILQAEKLAAVGKLAAGAAHEVLNPLASISSIAQLMRTRCDSDEQAKHIDLMLKEITRISKVLRELQTFAQPAPAPARSPVQVGEVLDHAMTVIGYDRRAKKTAITCAHHPALCAVNCDPDRLLLVFTNIMMNALDAMSGRNDASAALAITTGQTGGNVVVQFEDTGPGMTAEQVSHAFEPFFTTKRTRGGTGLGLWICYQVISGYKGTVKIDSRLGKGTKVSVELPCDRTPGV